MTIHDAQCIAFFSGGLLIGIMVTMFEVMRRMD